MWIGNAWKQSLQILLYETSYTNLKKTHNLTSEHALASIALPLTVYIFTNYRHVSHYPSTLPQTPSGKGKTLENVELKADLKKVHPNAWKISESLKNHPIEFRKIIWTTPYIITFQPLIFWGVHQRHWVPSIQPRHETHPSECPTVLATSRHLGDRCLGRNSFFGAFGSEGLLQVTVDGRNPANHLRCRKPCKLWDKLPINWCRIRSINSTFFVKQTTKENLYLYIKHVDHIGLQKNSMVGKRVWHT